MKRADVASGAVLMLLGALTVVASQRLPPMPGQPFGPSAFPTLIGALLAFCGLLIAVGVGSSFEAPDTADEAVPGAAPPPSRWLSTLRVMVPVGVLLFYVLASDKLGFVLTAAIMLLTLTRALGAGWRLAVGLAVVAPTLVHLVFAKFLRVPLPSGWLPMPW